MIVGRFVEILPQHDEPTPRSLLPRGKKHNNIRELKTSHLH